MNTKQNMNTFKWDKIPWALIEKYILQIQNRIYYAEKKNDNKHVYILQNKLSKSWSLQTKIFFELCFMEKDIKQLNPSFSFKKQGYVNELRELLQTSFPFLYNNENIRNKIFSIFFEKKSVLFCSKKSKKKNKPSSIFLKDYSNKATKNLKNFAELSVYKCEPTIPRIPIKLNIHLTNSKDRNSIILNKNFFILGLRLVEKQHFQQHIEKLNDEKTSPGGFDEPWNNYAPISLHVPSAKIKSLNCKTGISSFLSLSLLFFLRKKNDSFTLVKLKKKIKQTEKRKKKNTKSIKKFFNWFIDYKTLITHRADVPLFAKEILLKYYQFQYLQHFFLFSTSPMSFNSSLKNLTFEHSIFFIKKNIYNKKNKKDERKSNYGWIREFDILFKEKIYSYRKSKCLEKKIKSILQIFYLTRENPFFLIQKTDNQILKNNKGFRSSSPFKFTYLNEKMSFFDIKKIIKLARIKKKIEPQWQARYESYSYSLKKGTSAFNKIQAIYKTIYNEPKFILKIELKSLSQDLFIEQINDTKQDNYSLFPVHLSQLKELRKKQENFIDLLKNFFFYGLEKAFFHIFKKQYFNMYNAFFKQIIIFEKNQILILHENDLFLKNFCQFLFSSFLFFVDYIPSKKSNLIKRKKKNLSSRFLSIFSLDNGERKDHIDNSIVDVFFFLNKKTENLYSIKTQIVHSFMPYEKSPPGIDFLGFYINQLNKKKYLQKNIDLEYFKKPLLNVTKFNIQTFIAPSLSNVRNHLIQIRTIIKQSKTSTQELLIKKLSPKIRGWSKFYSQTFSLLDKKREYQKTAKYCDYLTFKMLWRWACRRHPNKNRKWIKLKYFKTLTGSFFSVFFLSEKKNRKKDKLVSFFRRKKGTNWVFCVTKKIEPMNKNTSHNAALIPLDKNFFIYSTSLYLCLPLHRDI